MRHLDGPHAALQLLKPPSDWTDSTSDIGWAEDVLIQLVKAKDWPAAEQLADQIFAREDLLSPERRTHL